VTAKIEKTGRAEAWTYFLDRLTASSRAAVAKPAGPAALAAAKPVVPNAAAYDEFRAGLTSTACDAVDQLADAEPPPEAEALAFAYILMESPDGECPTIRMYKTPEPMARRLGQIEGADTHAWAVYGVALPFTKGPQRYVLLPDGGQAIQVPLYHGGPCRTVPADLLDSLAIQEDGYVGPDELAESKVPDPPPAKQVPAPVRPAEEEEEEEEDE
jgi:hypothetical protein